MSAPWIAISILCVSAWESAGITNKARPFSQEGVLRNFRHIPGPSESVSTDWEVGLREAVNQALLRERYHEYNLRDRLLEAPLIGRREAVTHFGDIVILARGQLYVTEGGNFLFVQDQYQNDCDACHNPRPRCGGNPCQVWKPDENERLVALWTVKRLRHRNPNNGHYYELEYIVSPITPTISEFVARNGNFDYGVPGHIFVGRNDDKAAPSVDDRAIPQHHHHHHVRPEIIVGIAPDGRKHVLQSYPGFYTSFPVHPTYRQNGYSTNDPREIELYKELIESLAAKTSSTQKAETGPHKFSLNGYTKPSYNLFSTTQNAVVELSTKPLTTDQSQTHQKPSAVPTKPTELSTEGINTMKPETPRPITTFHYFTPIGEEDMITDGVTEMKKITLGTITATPEQSGSDFLFPELETTAFPKTTRTFYKPTTITEDVSNILEEPAFSSTHTTKQYQTTKPATPTTTTQTTKQAITRTKPASSETTTRTTKQYQTTVTRSKSTLPTRTTQTTKPYHSTVTKTRTASPTTTKQTTSETPVLKPTTTRNTPTIIKPRPSTTDRKVKVTVSTTPTSRTTESTTPKTSTIKLGAKVTTTQTPSTATMESTTVRLQTTKTKLSNLTGFISSTSSTNKITTYKPRYTVPKLTKTTTKLVMPETTVATRKTTRQQPTVPMMFTRTTQPQRSTIDLDYTLLEDILPTEPMTGTSPLTEMSFTSTMNPDTTVTTTEIPPELTSEGTTSQTTLTPLIYTTNTMETIRETLSTVTESIPERETNASQEDIVTESSTTSRPFTTDTTGTERTTITTTFEPDTMSTYPESTTTSKPTVDILKLKPSTTETSDFLTENGNEERPSPIKTDPDEYDIFGATKAQTKPTEASTTREITESDLAGELFGKLEPKRVETVLPKGTRIIYSDFFEASTASMPQTTQTEAYDTTTSPKPLTSQSYATSISFKVNKKNGTGTENDEIGTTVSDVAGNETKQDTKRSFDRIALQLINHAKTIDYSSENDNKTTPRRGKYKRRKTYIPKNKRLNVRKPVS